MAQEDRRETERDKVISILGLKFDKTINLGGVVALVVLLYSLWTGYNSIKAEFITTQRQHNLMWKHFLMHEADLTKEEVANFLRVE